MYSSEKYSLCYNSAANCNNDSFYHLNNKLLLQYSGGVFSDNLEIYVTKSEDSVAYNRVGSFNIQFISNDTASNYNRTLYMDKAISEVRYIQAGNTFKREVFSDFDNDRIIFHMESSDKAAISFVITVDGGLSVNQLDLIEADGDLRQMADSFIVQGASNVTVGISLNRVSVQNPDKSYNQIKKKHIKEFEAAYSKFFFQLDKSPNHKEIEHLFQYSRYVMLSSDLSKSFHPQFLAASNDSIFHKEIKPEAYMGLHHFVDYATYIKEKLVDISGDAINILPNLPSDWADKGRIVGVQMPGGFVIDLVWRDDEIKTLVVRSNLGGNCRLKVRKGIHGCKCLGMEAANGENSNPYYQNLGDTDLGKQLLSSYKIFDFETYAGQVAVFSGSDDN